VDETADPGGPTPGPAWLDDPFHRSGQRWWDGQQWTARTRPSAGRSPARRRAPTGDDRRPTPRPSPAPTLPGSGPSSRGALSLGHVGRVVLGIFVVFTLVGLVTPSAEDSAVAAQGDARAAYWSCADLLAQRFGPATTLEFPGDSSASITNEGPTWAVSGQVEVVDGPEPIVRAWRCTVTYDDGAWRGTAAPE